MPKWKAEHPCYSCHNNGDATRALLVAGAKGYDIGTSLDDTLAFLKQPAKWDQNKAPGGFDDKTLARVQFASALAVAERHGKAASHRSRRGREAAGRRSEGRRIVDARSVAEPRLAGHLRHDHRHVVGALDADRVGHAAGRLHDRRRPIGGFAASTPENVLDAVGDGARARARERRDGGEPAPRRACSILRNGQSPDGGWGPYVTAAPQVFDTAMAVLALSLLDVEPRLARSAYRPEELKEAIANGKTYLVSQQRPDGSWPETTRPANQESYAQRISTTGWAMLALLQ